MVRLIVWGVVLLCFPLFLKAQQREVVCLSPDWDKVFEQARREGKPIFVDCGATWCNPCKVFKTKVLGNDTVADFYNARFVNVYMDVDKDALPEAAYLPSLQAVPVLFFMDAEKREVVHVNVGASDVPGFLAMGRLVLEGKQTIGAMRERYRAGEMKPGEMLAFLQALSAGRYREEYREALAVYMACLTVDSLQSDAVWALCEREWNDPQAPLFREAWAERERLYAWHGKERVMKKFTDVFNWHLYEELQWKERPDNFNAATFEGLVSLFEADDLPDRDYYRRAAAMERAARKGDYPAVWKGLRALEKASMDEKLKKNLVKWFANKLVYNLPPETCAPYIRLVDKMAKQMKDAGIKSELYYFESDLWELTGNEQEAQKAYRLGVVTVNPHFYD